MISQIFKTGRFQAVEPKPGLKFFNLENAFNQETLTPHQTFTPLHCVQSTQPWLPPTFLQNCCHTLAHNAISNFLQYLTQQAYDF
jgi:hypothetical protein